MTGWLSIALLAAMGARPVVIPTGKLRPMAASPQVGNFTLNLNPPGTITFSATNPGTIPVVAGSSSVIATWSALASGNNWSLTVQATTPTFTNCSTVPVSAVTVSCSAPSITGLGGSANCAAASPLSNTRAVTVASGSEGTISWSYSVTISFTLADSWSYIAETSPACTLSLTYTANVP